MRIGGLNGATQDRYSTARICARIRLDDSLNPPNGSWGIVKVQPQSLIAVGEGRALTIPQLPLGGLGESSFVGVGRALTIPQLPLGGFGPCSSPLSWRTWYGERKPLVSPQVKRCIFVPEGRWIL